MLWIILFAGVYEWIEDYQFVFLLWKRHYYLSVILSGGHYSFIHLNSIAHYEGITLAGPFS